MSLLNDAAIRHFDHLNERIALTFLTPSEKTELLTVLGLSDFVADALIRQPTLLKDLLESNLLKSAQRKDAVYNELNRVLSSVTEEVTLHKVLRLFRSKHMVVIAWRDLLGKASLAESLEHTSYLADQLIMKCMCWLYNKQCTELGTPVNQAGVRQSLFIFAMGKLGGRELNFSSDIDLIFAYPERGETAGGRRRIDNQPFFIKLGQRIIGALHQMTIDGFVYRVDMRLRPFGESGPLVTTFASIEHYYQSNGRDWERYAMVKARVIGEPGDYKKALEVLLKPFVYRRYIDFSAIESLRKMKAMISAEVRRKGLKDNIKLGQGGIREVEFIAQAFQLIRGGRRPELQYKGLQETLKGLAEIGELPEEQAQILLDSYQFLRRVENILQEIGDKQTQTLPANELDQCRLITVMGYSTWQDFQQHLQQVMANIHTEFNRVVGEQEKEQEKTDQALSELWALPLSLQEASHLLHEKGLQEKIAAEFAGVLDLFKEELKKRPIGPRGQTTLDKLMPDMLERICLYEAPVELFKRLKELLLAILSRTAYLELLNENGGALNQLLKLCNASLRVASQLARYPILLDELLDPQQLYSPTKLYDYKPELQQFMLRIPEDDMEQQMDALRQFKQIQFLYIAAADIEGSITLPEVSDHLTYLSEAILDYVVQIAWLHMVEKFGLPKNVIDSDRKGFAVIGYGKMGGIELGYDSDLDLVFLHDTNIQGETNGARKIENQLFYFRLAQRIIHIFNTRTNSGILYEIDMRLRPSGDSGVLVSSVASYKKYLQNNAWTWEHQALVRARAVFFDQKIFTEFNEARESALIQARNNSSLATNVIDMRRKMRKHLNRAKEGEFDLKQSPGGMVDIEFIAQYLVLAYACRCDRILCKWSDNLRIFETCQSLGLLTAEEEKALTSAYCALRDEGHRLTLNKKMRIISGTKFTQERKNIIKIWNKLLG